MRKLFILLILILPCVTFAGIRDFVDGISNSSGSQSAETEQSTDQTIDLSSPFFSELFSIMLAARYSAYPFCETNLKFIIYPDIEVEDTIAYPQTQQGLKPWYLELSPALWGSPSTGWGGRIDARLRFASIFEIPAATGVVWDQETNLTETLAGLGVWLFLWDGLSLGFSAQAVYWGGYASIWGFRGMINLECWYFRPFHIRLESGLRNLEGVSFLDEQLSAGILIGRLEIYAGLGLLYHENSQMFTPTAGCRVYF